MQRHSSPWPTAARGSPFGRPLPPSLRHCAYTQSAAAAARWHRPARLFSVGVKYLPPDGEVTDSDGTAGTGREEREGGGMGLDGAGGVDTGTG